MERCPGGKMTAGCRAAGCRVSRPTGGCPEVNRTLFISCRDGWWREFVFSYKQHDSLTANAWADATRAHFLRSIQSDEDWKDMVNIPGYPQGLRKPRREPTGTDDMTLLSVLLSVQEATSGGAASVRSRSCARSDSPSDEVGTSGALEHTTVGVSGCGGVVRGIGLPPVRKRRNTCGRSTENLLLRRF